MFCPKCGEIIAQDTQLCPKCGEPLADKEIQAETPSDTEAEPEADQWYAPYEERQTESEAGGWYVSYAAQQAEPIGDTSAMLYNRQAKTTARDNAEKRQTGKVIFFCVLVLALILSSVFVVMYFTNGGFGVSAGEGKMGGGYDSPEALVTAYLDAFERGDVDAVADMLPKPVGDYFRAANTSNADVVYYYIDEYWSKDYGKKVMYWEVSDRYDYAVREFNFAAYGLKNREVSRFVNFSCEVSLNPSSHHGDGDYIFDFDLVLIGGSWYLIKVW